MKKQVIGAQGEITIYKIGALPKDAVEAKVERTQRGPIISHSESGHHHVLDRPDVKVFEKKNPAKGMAVLYAILDNPTGLVQDAPVPHEGYTLDKGIYEFRIAREFDPFSEQARRVAD